MTVGIQFGETRVEFHFEYFILPLKSGLLNRIIRSILQYINLNFLFY